MVIYKVQDMHSNVFFGVTSILALVLVNASALTANEVSAESSPTRTKHKTIVFTLQQFSPLSYIILFFDILDPKN